MPIWSSPPTREPQLFRTSPTPFPRNTGFWLGDAFASGGSAGYDHKKMAITARGAWECVKRHFREIGVDIQSQNSPSPASATWRATCSATACCNPRTSAWWPPQPSAHIHRPAAGSRPLLSRTPAAVQDAPLQLGRLFARGDLERRRSFLEERQDPGPVEGSAGLAGTSCAGRSERGDQGHIEGACRSVLERRHRHLREIHLRKPRRRRRPQQ